jgi:hypothetical protein
VDWPEGPPVRELCPGFAGGVPWPGYRRAFRRAVVQYLAGGGDWGTARAVVEDAVRAESTSSWGPAYRHPSLSDLWAVFLHAPECLARPLPCNTK